MVVKTAGPSYFRRRIWSGPYNGVASLSYANHNTDYMWMDSSNHNVAQLGQGNRDIGGGWRMYTFQADFPNLVYVPPWKPRATASWVGGDVIPSGATSFLPNQSLSSRETVFASMEAKSRSLAATAIAQTNPTVPTVDLGTAIGELLTGGLPSMAGKTLWKERSNVARGAGSEYLNYQFGWVPLLSDIQATASVVQDLDKLIREYESGSGKDQHRKFKFPETNSVVTETYTSGSNATGGGGVDTWLTGGNTVVQTTTTSKIWFSGCFRYLLPASGFERHAAIAEKFFGASITPSTLWNLAPWSWALDWESNVGDVLSNMSYLGGDASVMKYGYMMHERRIVREIIATSHSRSNSPLGGRVFKLPATIVETYKTRIAASPYGFSANPVPLTAKQGAIVAALGLSRT